MKYLSLKSIFMLIYTTRNKNSDADVQKYITETKFNHKLSEEECKCCVELIIADCCQQLNTIQKSRNRRDNNLLL